MPIPRPALFFTLSYQQISYYRQELQFLHFKMSEQFTGGIQILISSQKNGRQ